MALKDIIPDAINKIAKAVVDEIVAVITKAGPHGSVPVGDLQHIVDQLKAATNTPTAHK